MANYFDLTNNASLLKPGTRELGNIEQLVSNAEFDIIDYYTKMVPDRVGTPLQGVTRVQVGLENLAIAVGQPKVYLAFYKADADDLSTTNELIFKTSMQRAIAALVELRATEADREPGVKMQRRGRRTTEYFDNHSPAEVSVPHAVRRYLSKYDIRPVL